MKKILVNVLVLTILLSSCGKTTKGKISNDWKVQSYDEVYVLADNVNGNTTTRTWSYQGTDYTFDEVSSSGNTDHISGAVAYNNFQIKKDGTWSAESEISYVDDPNIRQTSVKKSSGTWSFIGKTKDDFKRKERVIFNTLYESETESAENIATGEVENSYADFHEANYVVGWDSFIYTVSESKSKKLILEVDTENHELDNSDNSTFSKTKKMVLVVD